MFVWTYFFPLLSLHRIWSGNMSSLPNPHQMSSGSKVEIAGTFLCNPLIWWNTKVFPNASFSLIRVHRTERKTHCQFSKAIGQICHHMRYEEWKHDDLAGAEKYSFLKYLVAQSRIGKGWYCSDETRLVNVLKYALLKFSPKPCRGKTLQGKP